MEQKTQKENSRDEVKMNYHKEKNCAENNWANTQILEKVTKNRSGKMSDRVDGEISPALIQSVIIVTWELCYNGERGSKSNILQIGKITEFSTYSIQSTGNIGSKIR